jgi:hypothetical protein
MSTYTLAATGTNIDAEKQAMIQATASSDVANLTLEPLTLMTASALQKESVWYALYSVGVAQQQSLPILTGQQLTWTNFWQVLPTGKHNLVPATFLPGDPLAGATLQFMPLQSGLGDLTLNFTTGKVNARIAQFIDLAAAILPVVNMVGGAAGTSIPLVIPAASFNAAVGYINLLSNIVTQIGPSPEFTVHISGDYGIPLAAHSKAANVEDGATLRIPEKPAYFVFIAPVDQKNFEDALADITLKNLNIKIDSNSGLLQILDATGTTAKHDAFAAITKLVMSAQATAVP